MKKLFYKYVLQNVAGMVGVSLYILADTFFISVAAGADGITVLNLALPIYGIIFAIGSMIGIGTATRYAIKKAQGKKDIGHYFTHALFWDILISVPFVLLGIFAPQFVLRIMGGDPLIVGLGKSYMRILLIGTPFFMMNYAFTAFARNDNAPTIAMTASLIGSFFNIIFDYILMFPVGMGLTGAALATACSPIVTMCICCIHYFSKNSTIHFMWKMPSLRLLFLSCQLGISGFVGEISSAVTTTVFNILLLNIAGNIGVAAYGIVANLSLIAMAIFNGVSQGVQPLISDSYGKGDTKMTRQFLKWGLIVTLVVEAVIVGSAWIFTHPMVGIFNSSGNMMLASYAFDALRLYFLGYVIAGVNVLLICYFSATGAVKPAFISSLLRGVLAISLCAIVMSKIFGMDGVWLSFLAAEFITFLYVCVSFSWT